MEPIKLFRGVGEKGPEQRTEVAEFWTADRSVAEIFQDKTQFNQVLEKEFDLSSVKLKEFSAEDWLDWRHRSIEDYLEQNNLPAEQYWQVKPLVEDEMAGKVFSQGHTGIRILGNPAAAATFKQDVYVFPRVQEATPQFSDFQTGPAFWKTAEHDVPVEVLGYLGEKDGRHYVKTSLGKGGIPLDEIEYQTTGQSAEVAISSKEDTVVSELVGFESVKEKAAALEAKIWSGSVRAAENVGKTLEDWVPSAVREAVNFGEHRTAIGGVAGALALLGGGLIVDRFARAEHAGRSKRGVWHGTDTGAVLGLGAGLLTLTKTGNPGSAAAALALGVLAGNTLYDQRFRNGDMRTNIVRNSLVAAVGVSVHHHARQIMPLAIQSFGTHLARTIPQGTKEFLSHLKTVPGLSALLSVEGAALAVAAASVPISHSIITRAMARRQRVSHAQSAILPSLMENPAGANGGRTYTGTVVQAVLPEADVYASGQLRTHYDMDRARRTLV